MTRLKVVQSALFALALALLVPALPNTANADPIPNGDTTALIDARTNAAPGDTIELAENGTYVLTSSQIVIDKEITIEGNGATIDGDGSFRVFFNTGDLTLNELTVTGGMADIGGGIFNICGNVTLNNSSVERNTAGDGGGIFNVAISCLATVILNGESSVSDNMANDDVGGIYNVAATSGSTATVILNGDSRVSDNMAGGDGGGIYNDAGFSGNATVILNGESSVSGNMANGNGGGIYNIDISADSINATVTMTENSSITNNVANADESGGTGGGIYNDGGTLDGPVAGDNVFDNEPNNIFDVP